MVRKIDSGRAPLRPVVGHVEDAADVGMGHLARELDLPPEPLDRRLVVGHLGADRLQGHALPELQVLHLVDLAHAAAGDEAHDPVAPAPRACRARTRALLAPLERRSGRSESSARARGRTRGPRRLPAVVRQDGHPHQGRRARPGRVASPDRRRAGGRRRRSCRRSTDTRTRAGMSGETRKRSFWPHPGQVTVNEAVGGRGSGHVSWPHCTRRTARTSRLGRRRRLPSGAAFGRMGAGPRGRPLQGDPAWRDDKHGSAGRARWLPPGSF